MASDEAMQAAYKIIKARHELYFAAMSGKGAFPDDRWLADEIAAAIRNAQAQAERVHEEWAQEHARVKMELNGWLRQASEDRDKFERLFQAAAVERTDALYERDKAQNEIGHYQQYLTRACLEVGELLQAAQEARAGHAGRLFRALDAMEGTDR